MTGYLTRVRSDISAQFQRLYTYVLEVAQRNGAGANIVQGRYWLVLENCGLVAVVAGMKWKRPISQHWVDITGQFQRLHPCFRGRPTQWSMCQYRPRSTLAGARKLWPGTWNELEKPHISALGRHNWTISTATPMFLRSPNSMEHVPMSSKVDIDRYWKTVAW